MKPGVLQASVPLRAVGNLDDQDGRKKAPGEPGGLVRGHRELWSPGVGDAEHLPGFSGQIKLDQLFDLGGGLGYLFQLGGQKSGLLGQSGLETFLLAVELLSLGEQRIEIGGEGVIQAAFGQDLPLIFETIEQQPGGVDLVGV